MSKDKEPRQERAKKPSRADRTVTRAIQDEARDQRLERQANEQDAVREEQSPDRP